VIKKPRLIRVVDRPIDRLVCLEDFSVYMIPPSVNDRTIDIVRLPSKCDRFSRLEAGQPTIGAFEVVMAELLGEYVSLGLQQRSRYGDNLCSCL